MSLPPAEATTEPELPVAALLRFAAATGGCELCGLAIGDDHEHAADVVGRQLRCCCHDCHAALDQLAGSLRAVPHRVLTGPGDDDAWDAVDVPVALAFLMRDDHGHVTAFYPSPAGPTESLLPAAAWRVVLERVGLAAELLPEVEALLLDRRRRPLRAHLLPVDRCYELVGRLRTDWHGIDGGPAVDAAVAEVLRDAVAVA